MPIARAIDLLKRHRATIVPTIWGPILGIAGTLVGTRVLTEVTSTTTFGEVKFVQGAVGLAVGVVARPVCQFLQREYHDAKALNEAEGFERFGWRLQCKVAATLAPIIIGSLALCRAVGLQVSLISCATAGAALVAEVLFSTATSFALTRNLQRLVSVLESTKQWGTPFMAAGCMFLISDGPALFILAQTLVIGACAVAAYRSLRAGGLSPSVKAETQRRWTSGAKSFAAPMALSGAFNWILGLGDRYLLGYFCTADEVGRYSAVYALISVPVMFAGGTLARIVYPLAFAAAARADKVQQQRIFRGQVVLGAAIGATAVLAVLVAGPWIVALALAPKYRVGSAPLLVWLAAAYGLLMVSHALELQAFARKATGAFTLSTGLAAATNICANVVLIPRMRATGAAIATFCGFAVYVLVNLFTLRNVQAEIPHADPNSTLKT